MKERYFGISLISSWSKSRLELFISGSVNWRHYNLVMSKPVFFQLSFKPKESCRKIFHQPCTFNGGAVFCDSPERESPIVCVLRPPIETWPPSQSCFLLSMNGYKQIAARRARMLVTLCFRRFLMMGLSPHFSHINRAALIRATKFCCRVHQLDEWVQVRHLSKGRVKILSIQHHNINPE